ncbi:MAG TPA: ATP-binding protein [Steroidobacteraceae bacterium]|nr:ATP-binding protein [Steroidobacteraceae bacterium]
MISIASNLALRVLDAAPDAMILIDDSGTICFANRRIADLFGYEPEHLLGQRVEALMPERFRVPHLEHREEYWRGVRVRPMGAGLELFGRRQDGSEFPLEISLSPIADGDRTLVAAAIRDVTDRKSAEADLIEARRAAELARTAADRANQGKSRFLATASHDLRQPLQTLSLLNGSLRRMSVGRDISEALLQQEQAIGGMSRLVNALLDISKLESGAIKPEPTDFAVAMLLEELRREFSNIAASKGLQLKIDSCSLSVHSDPSLVGQILRNLLSNAIKYTREGWVRLQCLRETARIRIDVLDTGIGIPADQLPYIYDEFYQVTGANRVREGYGLGLSIVQRLVRLLDLELDVHSDVGQGTTFSLVLPVGSAQAALRHGSAACPQPEKETGSKVRILLVEDNPAVRRATGLLLQMEGYEVAAVATLEEARAAANADRSARLVITDYHLADEENGIDVIAALRGTLGPVRAILMTGDTSSAIKELAGDQHLRIASKPINADELLGLVRAMLAGGPGASEPLGREPRRPAQT